MFVAGNKLTYQPKSSNSITQSKSNAFNIHRNQKINCLFQNTQNLFCRQIPRRIFSDLFSDSED